MAPSQGHSYYLPALSYIPASVYCVLTISLTLRDRLPKAGPSLGYLICGVSSMLKDWHAWKAILEKIPPATFDLSPPQLSVHSDRTVIFFCAPSYKTVVWLWS